MQRNDLVTIIIGFLLGVVVCIVIDAAHSDKVEYIRRTDWYCSDVRIDGLELPLTPVCWEYKRKEQKAGIDK